MGNHKFRLSNMIPNAWFYKLKDMNKPRNQHKKDTSSLSLSLSSSSSSLVATNDLSKITNQPHMSDQRKSYYFTRDLTNSPTKTEPPRISSRRRRRRRSTKKNQTSPRLVSTSISASCSCRASLESVRAGSPSLDQTTSSSSSDHDSVVPQYGSDRTDASFGAMPVSTNPCKCGMQNDIVFNIIDDDNLDRLPPIITKKKQVSTDMGRVSSQATNQRDPTKIHRTSAEFSGTNAYGSLSVKVVKEDFLSPTKRSVSTASPARRLSTQGVKLRTNSPRIANRRVQGGKISSPLPKRRSVSESFAVMKSSKDPRRDFRESMVQMIVENNLKASKDLEELLACYLSLNSDEYHDLIINVFKQIWFDYVHVRLN